MHELIRQFAAEQLASHPEEEAAILAHHSRYYLTRFSDEDGRLRSAAQHEALATLTAEMDNVRRAWDWAIANVEFAAIEPALRPLAIFYDIRGWFQEGIDAFAQLIHALEAADEQQVSADFRQRILAHALAAQALLLSRLGQHERAQAQLERSVAILRPLQEPHVLVETLAIYGASLELTGNFAQALARYTDGEALANEIGERWFAALCRLCRIGLMGITQRLVHPDETRARLLSIMLEWRAIGDPRWIAIGLNFVSWNALMCGCYAEARSAQEESVALNQAIGDRWGLSYAHRGLGSVAQALGEHGQAVEIFRTSLGLFTELGARQDVARILAEMSRSVLALGDATEAERCWHESLRIALETQATFVALDALTGLASLAAQRGEYEHGLELLLMILKNPAGTQETKARAAHLRAELETKLTPQQIEAAQVRANSLPP